MAEKRIELTYKQFANFVEMGQQVIDDFAALDNPSLQMAIVERGAELDFRLDILTETMTAGDEYGEAVEVVASMDLLGNVKMKQV